MIGFCNGLALVIGLAQVSNFKERALSREVENGASSLPLLRLPVCFQNPRHGSFRTWAQACRQPLPLITAAVMGSYRF